MSKSRNEYKSVYGKDLIQIIQIQERKRIQIKLVQYLELYYQYYN